MDKERIATIRLLTSISIYTLFLFFSTKKILFPFPLNEVGYFVLISYFVYLHRNTKKKHTELLTIGLSAIFYLLSNEFYWNLFLNSEQMTRFSKLWVTDLAYILFVSSVGIEIIRSISVKFIAFAFIGLMISGLILNNELILALSLFLSVIFMIFSKQENLAKYVCISLSFLLFTKWLTLH